jgi:hypothetical protein
LTSPCPFLFRHEAWKCTAPTSNVCLADACDVSFRVYNTRTQRAVGNTLTTNGTTITGPPCKINIEAVVPCVVSSTGGTKVRLELLRNGVVVRQREEVARYFLFGNTGTTISAGTIATGTYTIRAVVNGIVQPKPITFTLAGTCVN